MICAVVAPTLPAPTTVILALATSISHKIWFHLRIQI
jgi:hypothetical protein